MTLQEIKTSDRAVLFAKDVAPVLESDPFTLSTTAKTHPERVGFPYFFSGNQMKVPRKAFLRWIGEEV